MANRDVDPGPAGIPASASFRYEGGALHADGHSLEAVADQVGTPAYVYSAAAIDAAYRGIDAALSKVPHVVAYAVKANGNLAILSRLAAAGCGADIVSGGELKRALAAGFPPSRIVFSGVGKTDDEIRAALEAGIRSIHAESAGEVEAIEAIAGELGTKAPIALRVNPDVDAKTHPYISTGLHSTKFGLELDVAEALLPRLLESPALELEGIACHIGSMVLDPDPIGEAVEIVARFARRCADAGAPIRTVDAGGGWPILYGDEGREAAGHATFGRVITDALERGGGDGFELMVEPGRSVVGDAGVLLTRVLYTKQQGDKRFVVVDGAMTELIRPALYGAYHATVPVREPAADAAMEPVDLVGPVCESGDFLAKDRPMPPLQRGDLIAIRGAGAYSAVMASNYNSRPFAPEVLVIDGQAKVIRQRQSVEDLWRDETKG
ncbi:MAG: diaminopimelate decarboxylase [Myxococcales bacterium]|nr:diaminopimelate decarboxylase [Myxococcales bacterium]